MVSIGEIILHLNALEPQRSVVRLCFVNFLKNACEANDPFSAATLDNFYRKTLSFQYWQNRQETLGHQIEEDLSKIGKSLGFDIHKALHAQSYQVFAVRSSDEFFEIASQYDKQQKEPSDQLQHIQLKDKKLLRLTMSSSGRLCAEVLPQMVLLRHGLLEPLTTTTNLQYGSDVEFAQGEEQWVEILPQTFARFFVRDGHIFGHILRGHVFQKEGTLSGPLTRALDVYTSIKNIERYYVDPQSDPLYQQVMNRLEDATEMKIDGPRGRSQAEAALMEGKSTVQRLFPNDKLLSLLVNNLEFKLRQSLGRPTWPKTTLSASTSSSPKPDSLADAELTVLSNLEK